MGPFNFKPCNSTHLYVKKRETKWKKSSTGSGVGDCSDRVGEYCCKTTEQL